MSGREDFPDIEDLIPGSTVDANSLFVGTSVIVRDALAQDLKESPLSRDQVADGLTRLTGRRITAVMIDAYVSQTKQAHRFPAEMAPAWTYLLKSQRLLAAICRQVGLSIATREDREFAELGRIRLKDQKLTRRLWERV